LDIPSEPPHVSTVSGQGVQLGSEMSEYFPGTSSRLGLFWGEALAIGFTGRRWKAIFIALIIVFGRGDLEIGGFSFGV